MAHRRNLFCYLSTSGLSLQPFNPQPCSNRSAFRRHNRYSADEDLIIWKSNCDRKAGTNKYLGLSSGIQISIRKRGPEDYREGEVLGLQLLWGEREKLRSIMC
jgi:hypothetical protein